MGGVDSILGRLIVSERSEQGKEGLTSSSCDRVERCQVRVKEEGNVVHGPEHEYPEKEVDEPLAISLNT